jgi:F-type H+-transporting ATPase subunit delta
MNLGKIPVRYAKALFQLSVEKNLVPEISADMKLLFNALKEVPTFHYFIVNPVMPLPEKKKRLHEIFKDQVHPLTMDFIDLIIRNNRLQHLEGMARQFNDLYKSHEGITEVVMTTVVPLDPELRDRITKLVRGKAREKVAYQEVHNPDVIGGFILRIEDEQIDASVATHLQRIRNTLKKEHRS